NSNVTRRERIPEIKTTTRVRGAARAVDEDSRSALRANQVDERLPFAIGWIRRRKRCDDHSVGYRRDERLLRLLHRSFLTATALAASVSSARTILPAVTAMAPNASASCPSASAARAKSEGSPGSGGPGSSRARSRL